jgi:hypothetical protein
MANIAMNGPQVEESILIPDCLFIRDYQERIHSPIPNESDLRTAAQPLTEAETPFPAEFGREPLPTFFRFQLREGQLHLI